MKIYEVQSMSIFFFILLTKNRQSIFLLAFVVRERTNMNKQKFAGM